jgi:hypothetical protein
MPVIGGKKRRSVGDLLRVDDNVRNRGQAVGQCRRAYDREGSGTVCRVAPVNGCSAATADIEIDAACVADWPQPVTRGQRPISHMLSSLRNRNTNFTETPYGRVDVTEEFSFLVTKMSPYFDR